MSKKKIFKRILYAFAGLVVLLAIAVFVFAKFYFEDYANSTLIPKLNDAVVAASHGKYALKVERIYFSGGSIFGKNVRVFRTRYDSSEHGVVVKRLTIDTVLFNGINWWSLAFGRGLYITSLEINSPKLYTTDADAHESSIDTMTEKVSYSAKSLPEHVPVISLDSILLNNIDLYLPTIAHPGNQVTFHTLSLRIHDFLLDSASLKNQPLFYSKRVDFVLPRATYDVVDSLYSIDVVNLHGNLSDSLLTIDSFAYRPNFGDDAFAAHFPYAQGRLEFHCTDLALHGIDFPRLLTASGIAFRKCEAKTWKIDFYLDARKRANPHPPVAPMPNELVSKLKFAIALDSLILNEGKITVRNRQVGSLQQGMLFFTHARVAASPFSTDSMSLNFTKATRIAFRANFLGEGLVAGIATYPLHHKTFDLDITATVGAFDAKKLNPWLIPVERKEMSDGALRSGDIRMIINSGVGTTTVTPRYENLYMKILATAPKEKSGIFEGIKSFLANTFVLKSNNLDKPGKPAKSGTTKRARKQSEEFFEFIWLALRQSLGSVLGGFK